MSSDLMHEYESEPRIQPYDPLPPCTGNLTVNVEWQRQDRDNWKLGMVETERTGRCRIVVEGESAEISPYLDAVWEILNTQEVVK